MVADRLELLVPNLTPKAEQCKQSNIFKSLKGQKSVTLAEASYEAEDKKQLSENERLTFRGYTDTCRKTCQINALVQRAQALFCKA